MDDLVTIKNELIHKTPAKRVKFLRQKILKKNQFEFCQDGIIRTSTLKLIETEKLSISPRIAERLAHRFRLGGIVCDKDLFLEYDNSCDIKLDDIWKRIVGPSITSLEEIRNKSLSLTPFTIEKDLCPSLIPKGATALVKELKEDDLIKLNKTLCLVNGTHKYVSFLTYENNQIISECNGKAEYLPANLNQFCRLYAIEILYFNE